MSHFFGWCAGWFGASVCGGLGAGAAFGDGELCYESARRPRRVVRGLGHAFLYLSIYLSMSEHASELRVAQSGHEQASRIAAATAFHQVPDTEHMA